MDERVSNQIRLLSLVCTIFVVYRHAYTDQVFFAGGIVPNYLQEVRCFLSRVTSLAVPSFFLISGLFFFRHNYYRDGLYASMLKKKVRTLLIPFLIWNIVGGIALFTEKSPLLGCTINERISNLFLSHWYGPLWYVRDLMIWMLLYPIYGWIFKVNCKILYAIVFAYVYYCWIPIGSNLMAYEVLLFFFLGGILSKYEHILHYKMSNRLLTPLAIVWLSWSMFTPLLLSIWSYKMYVCIGIILLWQVTKRINVLSKRTLKMSQESFLLYVTHIYVLKIIKEIVAVSFYNNGIAALLTYLLGPIVAVSLISCCGYVWKVYFPKSYEIALGGR